MRILSTIITLVLLSACGHSNSKGNIELEKVSAVAFAPPVVANSNAASTSPAGEEASVTDTSKKVIKTGEINFQTDNLDETRKKILHSLKKLDGYVAEESQSNEDGGRKSYDMELRIPAKNFDKFLDSISADAQKIDSKDIRIKDVTRDFIDVKARLANSKTLENTYLGLLKKADKMSDLVQIENKLTEIRTQIDSTQGVLNYLNRQVAYSSLSLTFYIKQTAGNNVESVWSRIKTAISDGWDLLQSLFFGLISIWPIGLIIVLLYIFVKRWIKRRRARKQAASA